MRILGREIDLGKIMPLLHRHFSASIIGGMQRFRLKSGIDNIFKSGYSLPPSVITIETTYLCNLRCKTCWFYGTEGIMDKKNMSKSLSITQLKKIADDVAVSKPYIYLTGGEPLINKSLLEFIRYATKKGIVVGMVTNGTLIYENNAKDIIDSGIDFITISIDGPEKIHNNIRGKVCFKKSIDGIKYLLKARGKNKLPVITLNCTISDYNYLHLLEIQKTAEDIGVDIVAFQHPCFLRKNTIKTHHTLFKKYFEKSDKLVEGYGSDTALNINPEELFKIINKIKRSKKRVDVRIYQDLNYRDTIKYYKTENAVNNKCVNPWYSAIIKPNGDVTPCLGYVVGNINEKSFKEIWNNNKFKHFRKILKQRKYYPGCIRCCGFFYNW